MTAYELADARELIREVQEQEPHLYESHARSRMNAILRTVQAQKS